MHAVNRANWLLSSLNNCCKQNTLSEDRVRDTIAVYLERSNKHTVKRLYKKVILLLSAPFWLRKVIYTSSQLHRASRPWSAKGFHCRRTFRSSMHHKNAKHALTISKHGCTACTPGPTVLSKTPVYLNRMAGIGVKNRKHAIYFAQFVLNTYVSKCSSPDAVHIIPSATCSKWFKKKIEWSDRYKIVCIFKQAKWEINHIYI